MLTETEPEPELGPTKLPHPQPMFCKAKVMSVEYLYPLANTSATLHVPGLGLPTETSHSLLGPVYDSTLASGMAQGPVTMTCTRSLGLHAR